MREIEELTSIEMVENFIHQHSLSFIYISRPDTCEVPLSKLTFKP